jgi:hypothetical protein
MDSGFFKVWLTDIYGDQRELLMNFALVRCCSTFTHSLYNDLSHSIDLITAYMYNKYVDIINNDFFINNEVAPTNIIPIEDEDIPPLIDISEYDSDSIPSISDDGTDIFASISDSRINYADLYYQNPELYIYNIDNNIDNQIEINFLEKNEITCSLQEDQNQNQNQNQNCCICYEDFNKELFVELGCKHEFCKECFIKVIKSNKVRKPYCSYCRSEIKTIKTRTYDIKLEIDNLTI